MSEQKIEQNHGGNQRVRGSEWVCSSSGYEAVVFGSHFCLPGFVFALSGSILLQGAFPFGPDLKGLIDPASVTPCAHNLCFSVRFPLHDFHPEASIVRGYIGVGRAVVRRNHVRVIGARLLSVLHLQFDDQWFGSHLTVHALHFVSHHIQNVVEFSIVGASFETSFEVELIWCNVPYVCDDGLRQ